MNHLTSEHTTCARCALSTAGRSRVVAGTGNNHARIALVGEAPGREEDELGVPFVGRSGQLLRALMKQVGIDPMQCFFSNLIQCRPPNNNFDEALRLGGAVCRTHWLYQELQDVKPAVIIAVGARAGRVLLAAPERTTATELATMSVSSEIDHWTVLGCFHPSFALRSGENAGTEDGVCRSIRRSLRRALTIVEREGVSR